MIALVGSLFKQGVATAIGSIITCGFTGLVISSPIIGLRSGTDPRGLGRGLLLLPVCSVIMAVLYLVLRGPMAGRKPLVLPAPLARSADSM